MFFPDKTDGVKVSDDIFQQVFAFKRRKGLFLFLYGHLGNLLTRSAFFAHRYAFGLKFGDESGKLLDYRVRWDFEIFGAGGGK